MKRIILFAAALLCASPALAQSTYPTPAGSRVQGVVPLVCDATGANCAPAGTAAAGSEKVQGDTANGATDAGNPVKIGGVSSASFPSATSAGQRVNAWYNANGAAMVGVLTQSIPADNTAGSNFGGYLTNSGNTSLYPVTGNMLFNGVGWDRARGDQSGAYVVEVPSAVAAAGVTVNATAAASSALVAKASAGNLYGYNVVSGASAGYLLIFNSTTAPADGTVTPARCIPLAANTGVEVDLRGQPTYFSAGITFVFSTTGCFTKTASATAFIAADVR